jgi:hypothetical protein
MGTGREPATRASNARDFFDFLRRGYPSVHAHLRATLSPALLERIEEGVRTDWIPIDIDGPYVDAVLAYMGTDALKTASRHFVSQSLVRSPAIRSLFEGVLAVFGVNVGGFLRVLPAGFRQSYRDAFTLTVERAERDALVVFADIAPEVLRFEAYPVIWEGLFLGLYDLARTPPKLEFTLLRSAARVEARFKW